VGDEMLSSAITQIASLPRSYHHGR